MDMHEQQMLLERKMFDDGVAQWKASQDRNISQGSASNTAWNRRLTKEWVLPLAEGVQAYLDVLKGTRGKRSKGAYILAIVKPEVAAYICIKTLFDTMGQAGGEGLTVTQACKAIGSRIEDNIRFTKLEDAAPKYIERVKESLDKAFSHKYQHQANVMAAAERRLLESARSGSQEYVFTLDEWQKWSNDECVQVGLLMLDIARNVLTINGEPAFSMQKNAVHGRNDNARIFASAATAAWCREFIDEMGKMFPQFAPCVIKPRDWIGPFDGGYHTPEVACRLPLVKSGRHAHRRKLTRQQMPLVYQAVNYLQGMRWQVNTELLAAVEDCISTGKDLAMPSREPYKKAESPVPQEYRDLHGKELRDVMSDAQWDVFMQWKADTRKVHEAENTRVATLLKFSSVLGQAREYSAYPEFYFVWNLDSRGRVYCNSSRLSPQGEDICKALIIPVEGAKLGENGRKWLAVHGANVFDVKGCFDTRVKWVEDHTQDILDYAALPTVFTDWTNADKPWQFLAWCMEWSRMHDWINAGNAESEFYSRIPVAMDGSCSGIQHYSAMLRDEIGGFHVNLIPSDKPQDIYGAVAQVVCDKLNKIVAGEMLLAAESLNADGVRQDALAQGWLEFGIDRGLCKKPVMTLPYGATQMTARESIQEKLEDADKADAQTARREGRPYVSSHAFGPDGLDRKLGLTLCTSAVWSSIGEIVKAARTGMDYIRKIARAVSAENMGMQWTTPTGFIVEQCIYTFDSYQIDTCLLGRLALRMEKETKFVDPYAMQGASAPNFVHSMDASHLVFVCAAAQDAGIPALACIHDSFGASAGQTEMLRGILRSTFVKMYSEHDVISELKESTEAYSLVDLSEITQPERGYLDLNSVLNSEYCFA